MLKVDSELVDIEKSDQNLIRDIKNLNTKLDILSAKLYDKRQNNASEKDQCQFVHMKLVDKLRDDEMSVIQLENELISISNEIVELKRAVLDRHHEALNWETKWKMIEEAKRQNDEEYAKSGEIGSMKMEIRRMEVRLGELKRAQEKLVADMELCVHHREHIFDQANMRNKLPHKKSKLVDTMQYRFNQLQSKLIQVNGEVKEIEKQTGNVVSARTAIEDKLDKLNQDIDDERTQYMLMQNEIEQAVLLKQEVNHTYPAAQIHTHDFLAYRWRYQTIVEITFSSLWISLLITEPRTNHSSTKSRKTLSQCGSSAANPQKSNWKCGRYAIRS